MRMQVLTTISVRDFLRDYKAAMSKVVSSGHPIVITNRQKPQVAIVNVKDLQGIEDKTALEKTKNLLEMAKEAEVLARKYEIKGPKNLSINHDKYTWGPYE